MNADDPRHGTNAGAIAHAFARQPACQPCKTAHAAYKKKRRTRVYLNRGPLLIDPTGTHRRIEALMWLGYTLQEISQALGRQRSWVSHMMRTSDLVHVDTRDTVAALFRHWCLTLPPTGPMRQRTRNLARNRGYQPPLAWDDIDDPTERPKAAYKPPAANRGGYDEAAVLRILAGDRVSTTKAEKVEAMRRWTAKGRSARSLEERMGWKQGRYTSAKKRREVAA